jgi:hypothetical protein
MMSTAGWLPYNSEALEQQKKIILQNLQDILKTFNGKVSGSHAASLKIQLQSWTRHSVRFIVSITAQQRRTEFIPRYYYCSNL